MSLLVLLNGVNYIIPQPSEVGWGTNLDNFFVGIAAGCLQKTGGSFTLSADVDFGASFGLKSLYYLSRTANPAAAGVIKLANADVINWRNAANTMDLSVLVNASNQFTFSGAAGTVFFSTTLTGLTGNSFLYSGSGGLLSTTAAPTNGQLLIGSTGTAPAVAAPLGTANQVNITLGAGSLTFSLPQSIATSSTPTFANLTLTSAPTFPGMTLSNDLTMASLKGIFFTDDTTHTVKILAKAGTTTHTYNLPTAQGAANQYLTNDGSGNLSWTNAAGTGTVNNGTQYQVAYYATSTNAVSGLSTLLTNASGWLGVGVSPTNAFQVKQASNIDFTIGAAVTLAGAVALNAVNDVSNANIPMELIATQFAFSGMTNPVKIVTSGQFQAIDGTVAAPGLSFVSQTGMGFYKIGTNILGMATAGTEGFRMDASQNTQFAGFIRTTDGSVTTPAYSFTNNTGMGLARGGANILLLATAGTEALRINATQQVGINVAPVFVFQVKNSSNIDFAVGPAVALAGAIALNAVNDVGNTNIPMELRATQFAFSGPTGPIYIDVNGNLGINVASPSGVLGSTAGGFILKDAGRAASTTLVAFQDSSGNSLYSTTAGGTHTFKHGSTTSLTVDSSGNVNVAGQTNLLVASQQTYPIVQVVSATGAASQAITNAAFVTTNVTATITPKFSTSKILVTISAVATNGAGGTVSWTLERNASNLLNATDGFWRSAANNSILLSYTYYDSPGSTSAQTYALYTKAANGTTLSPNNETWSIVLTEYAQ